MVVHHVCVVLVSFCCTYWCKDVVVAVLCWDMFALYISNFIPHHLPVYISRNIVLAVLVMYFYYGKDIISLTQGQRRQILYYICCITVLNPIDIYLCWHSSYTVYGRELISWKLNLSRVSINACIRTVAFITVLDLHRWPHYTVEMSSTVMVLVVFILLYCGVYVVSASGGVSLTLYLTHWQIAVFIVAYVLQIAHQGCGHRYNVLCCIAQHSKLASRVLTTSVFFGFWQCIIPNVVLYDDNLLWGKIPNTAGDVVLLLFVAILLHGTPCVLSTLWPNTQQCVYQVRPRRAVVLFILFLYLVQVIVKIWLTGYYPYPGSDLHWALVTSTVYLLLIQHIIFNNIKKKHK